MKTLLATLILLCACATDTTIPSDPGAAGGASERPVVNVDAKQFEDSEPTAESDEPVIAPENVGVSKQALQQVFTIINTDNGAEIDRAPGNGYFGFRCWLMSKCINNVCTNDQFTVDTFSGALGAWPKGQTPTNSNVYRMLGCTAFGCSIFKPAGTLVGAFEWGSDSNYVFRTGFVGGLPYAACKFPGQHPRLTVSSNPL